MSWIIKSNEEEVDSSYCNLACIIALTIGGVISTSINKL